MGPGPQDTKEGRVLNCIMRWLLNSIEYECDRRKIEKLISQCGFDCVTSEVILNVLISFKEYQKKTNYKSNYVPTTEQRKEYARRAYLKKKEKIQKEENTENI